MEEEPMRNFTTEVVINFVEEFVIMRFEVPQKLATDNDVYFISFEMIKFGFNYGI